MQFQFRPQFLVLFCHTNTLDRENKQEDQGLMANLRINLSGERGPPDTSSHIPGRAVIFQFVPRDVLRKPQIHTVNPQVRNDAKTPMCSPYLKWDSFGLNETLGWPSPPSPVELPWNFALHLFSCPHLGIFV